PTPFPYTTLFRSAQIPVKPNGMFHDSRPKQFKSAHTPAGPFTCCSGFCLGQECPRSCGSHFAWYEGGGWSTPNLLHSAKVLRFFLFSMSLGRRNRAPRSTP